MCQPNCKVGDMFTHLHTYMKEGKFADVVFIIGETSVGAHKAVLASSSKVFRAMFESEMMESLTQEVVISDVDVEAFRAFLDYIYTKNDGNVGDHLEQLFMLADKYDVEPLAVSCESYILKSLNSANVVKYFQLSDLHSRDELKKSLTDFMKNNLKDVIHTDDWLEMKIRNPRLVSAVVQSLIDDRVASESVQSYADTDKRFCDAVIKIQDSEFPVDKYILTGKSAEFSKIFEGDPKEGRIDGISVPQFLQLMDYVYFNLLPKDVLNLRVAMTFKLDELVNHTVGLYKQSLWVKNSVSIVILAHQHRLDSLKTPAMEYIVKNLDAVKMSADWKDLFEHPDLMTEIFLKTKAGGNDYSEESD